MAVIVYVFSRVDPVARCLRALDQYDLFPECSRSGVADWFQSAPGRVPNKSCFPVAAAVSNLSY